MPLKIWYNGSMHNMTTLKMVTFVGGVKKKLAKGVTFVNGQKKVLWQTGNFSINSWTLSGLGYPNQNALPVGMYSNLNRVMYSVGEYVARSNVSNISAPTNENCVKNGKVRTWLYPYYTGSNESFAADVKSYVTQKVTTTMGQTMTVTTELTTVNRLNVNTNDMSITATNSASDNKNNTFFYNGTYAFEGSYGWIVVKTVKGSAGGGLIPGSPSQYALYKNSTTSLANIPVTGYNGGVAPYFPQLAINSNYVFVASVYQANAGETVKYGLKRVQLSNGTVTDIESNLSKEVTSVMIDGNYVVYTYDNKFVKRNISNNATTIYTGTDTPLVLLGRIGDYYYLGSSRSVSGSNAKYLDIHIIDAENMALREKRNTNSKATIINALPYVSNNEYLCFGTYHSVGQAANSTTNISVSYRTLPSGTLSDVQYRIVRIHGF